MTITDVLDRSERRTDRELEGLRILLAAAWSVSPRTSLPDLVDWACVVTPQLRAVDPAVLAGVALGMNLPGLGA